MAVQSNRWSLRRRLLAWLLIPMLLGSLLLLVQMYFSARSTVEKVYDQTLLALALAISESVVATHGDLISEAMLEALETITSDTVFYKVIGPNNAYVTGYDSLPPAPAELNVERGIAYYYDDHYYNQAVRSVVLDQFVAEYDSQGWVRIQVAMTRNDRDELLTELVQLATLRLLLLVVLAGIIIWLAVSYGLQPLVRVERELQTRSADDLHALESDVPHEIHHLATAINHLMARLAASLETMRRFTADAAHQLRTPLTALRMQTELAQREREPAALRAAVEKLHDATRRTSHLAQQLLNHSQASDFSQALRTQALDLTALTADITRGRVPLALKKNIDLGFEGSHSLDVHGDPVMLGELLKNLIDNAIHYCPQGAKVTVRTGWHIEPDSVRLEVEDNGPGIAPAERERVFERFYRGADAVTEGCGLGLAIVREIVLRHGGTIQLANAYSGQGLLVKVILPIVLPKG